MRMRNLAFLQAVLLLPAALFMASLIVRTLGPPSNEPAHAAQRIVMWYAGRLWTLRVLLFALPCLVLVSGCAALRTRVHGRPRLVAFTTAASAGILAIVAVHVLTH